MDSLKREDDTRKKINQKIHEKVNNNVGTWIDWQYLLNAGSLLAKVKIVWLTYLENIIRAYGNMDVMLE